MAAFSENSSNHNITNASYWPNTLLITGLAASIAVNALVTSMIVFRILKATGDRPTSVERTLGSAGSNKFRHIMFIVIESGHQILPCSDVHCRAYHGTVQPSN